MRFGSEASARLCSLLGAALTVGSWFSNCTARALGGLDGNRANTAAKLSVCRGCGLAVIGESLHGGLGIETLRNFKKIFSGKEQEVLDSTNPAQRSCGHLISGNVKDQVGA